MPVYPSGGTIAQSAGSPGFGPAPEPSYNASASVRFNPADSAYISFIPSLQGARTTFTWSGWVKRSSLSSRQMIISQYPSASRTDTNTLTFEFNASDQLRVAGETTQFLLTNAVFRDVSSWYHVQVTINTTNATAADRVIVYVNGVRQTTSAYTAPAQNALTGWGLNGVLHYIGGLTNNSLYFNGYLADVNYVDGLALTPSSFTSTDSNTGQLVPIQYTGAFGRNGFYLPFSGAALAVDLGQNPKTTGQDYPYWPMNTLLVDTTNENGANNNTIVDSSTNNFSITRTGNTTQGNFTPFNYGGGTAQANGYYSAYFDGSGDYAFVSGAGESINFGTNNFTIEAWFNVISLSTDFYMFDTCPNGVISPTNRIIIRVTTNGALQYVTFQGTSILITSANSAVTVSSWNHVALVKNNGSTALYLNGIQVGSSYADSLNYPAQTNRPIMGEGYGTAALGTGYISNLRIVKGTAVYTANFTPPTAPLTAIAGTSLLTCQSSQFIDNSTNAASITTAGNTITLPNNPFAVPFYWAGLFDGSGDYLTVPGNTAFSLNTGSWTVECWFYQNSSKQVQVISSGAARWRIDINTSQQVVWLFNTSSSQTSNLTAPLKQWNHVAVCYNGTTCVMYLNGTAQTATGGLVPAFDNTSTLYIGRNPDAGGGWDFNGYISNARIVKGTAVYTANFTPPTAPLTAIAGTSLLTCQSSTFVDNSPNAFTITPNGNAYMGLQNFLSGDKINYTTPPVQAWSNYFDAPTTSGGGIIFNSSPNFALGLNDFTVEGWWFPNRVAETTNPLNIAWFIGVVGNVGSAGGGVATDQIQYRGGGSPNQVQVTTNVTGWNHIAWVRQGGVMRVYLNGIIIGSGADTTNITAGEFQVARAGTSTYRFSGYASNVRLTRGAVYTANFTPPTEPLTATINTLLLTCQSNRWGDTSIYRNFVQLISTYFPNMSVSPVSPFFPTTSWSAASYGGSLLLDGTGDSLTIPASAQFNIGASESFTVECWVYNTSTLAQTIFTICDTGTSGYGSARLFIKNAAGSLQWLSTNASGAWAVNLDGFGNARQNTWTHLAFVRNGGTYLCFQDGQLVATATYSNALVQDRNSFIGTNSGTASPFSGYISGFRFLKGVAAYTAPFTPPVQTFTNVSNTSVLLNATNSGIYNATGTTAIETVGNAQVSTAVKKWGESSMYFDGAGDYLVIPPTPPAIATFGTADFTVEGWIYPTIVTATQNLMGNRIASTGANNWDLVITSASKLAWGTTSTNYLLSTSSLLVNTWQHIAVSRVSGTTRMFINGTLEATNTTVITLSANSQFNIGSQGSFNATTSNFNGYMQDVRISKGVGRYSGNFTPPAAAFAYNQYDIGNQQWRPTNISVTAGIGQDNLVDSPSDYGTDTGLGAQVRGNYATLNPLRPASYGAAILTNGSLNAAQNTTVYVASTSTVGVRSGKWYWEVTCGVAGFVTSIGITSNLEANAFTTGMATYHYDGTKYIGATNSAYGAAYTNNDVIGFALDLDAGTLVCYKNGASQGTLISGLSGTYYAYTTLYGSNNVNFNFGQRAFAYAAPSGFKCLVSTNLPTVNGIGATSSTQADNYFDVTTYTGNGTTQSVLLPGAGFTPDFTWIKSRSSGTEWHVLCDSLRGPNKLIYSNSDLGEATVTNVLNSFDSGGFSVGFNSAYTSARTNTSAATYLGLAWRANGSSGATNNDGSITATVSANTTNGFSVVRYTGTGANGTIGHGLGKQLKFIMVKELSNTDSWLVWHIALPGTNYMVLNSQGASTAGATVWNSTVPSSSAPYVFSVGTNTAINQSGQQYVAYCFTDISSFSSMGSFAGNGSADGPFIYTGFKPAWFFTKKYTAVGAAQAWSGMNDVTLGYNTANYQLYLQTSGAEQTGGAGGYYDILSNGFKLRTNNIYDNNASDSYIYVAFAAFPFKYSRAY